MYACVYTYWRSALGPPLHHWPKLMSSNDPGPSNTKQAKTREVRVLLHLVVGDLRFTQPDLPCRTTPKDGTM